MDYLTAKEILDIHQRQIALHGGSDGIRDRHLLESAIAQPRMTFGGEDLYPDLASKAVALGFSLILNHPFLDGNKRVGYVALETFLALNGFELAGSVDEKERVVLAVAAGDMDRDAFVDWVREHLTDWRSERAR